MVKSKDSTVNATIKEIRAFHKTGEVSLKKIPGRASSSELKSQAEQWRLSLALLRKARQFADSETGYNHKDLIRLCHLIKEQKTSDSSVVFGRAHLVRFLAVPKAERQSWEKEAIENYWTFRRLGAEISKRLGRRKIGGRRQAPPQDAHDILVQIEKMCVHWRRWHDALSDLPVNAPKDLERLINEATKALGHLEEATSQKLSKKWKERELVQAKAQD